MAVIVIALVSLISTIIPPIDALAFTTCNAFNINIPIQTQTRTCRTVLCTSRRLTRPVLNLSSRVVPADNTDTTPDTGATFPLYDDTLQKAKSTTSINSSTNTKPNTNISNVNNGILEDNGNNIVINTNMAADDYSILLNNNDPSVSPVSPMSPMSQSEHKQQFTPFQIGIRATTLLTTLYYQLNPQPLDDLLSTTYTTLYNWQPTHAPLFEAQVAVMGFFTSIVFYSSLHLFLSPDKTRASRFDGQMPTKPFEWLEPQKWYLSFNPTFAYLASIWIYHLFVHAHAAIPQTPPSFGVFTTEVLFGIWLYDCTFFFIHVAMHKSSFAPIRKIHGYHHRITSHSLNSLETVQHSYLDGFLQVAVNILVQQITPFGDFGTKHFISRLAHNLIVTYLLSEAHSGYDLPFMSHQIWPEVLGGAPRHEKHHHDGRVYYQQYFMWLDDFFGFTNDNVKGGKKIKMIGIPKENVSIQSSGNKGAVLNTSTCTCTQGIGTSTSSMQQQQE